MKRILIFALAVLLFATACQVTPEAEIVVQKDVDRMIEKAEATLPPEIEKFPLTERYAVKEHLTKQLEKVNGKLVINVNADVVVPGTDTLSITQVVPANFSQATVSAFFTALCVDTVMYKPSPMTKAYIEQAMISCEAELSREGITENDAEQVRQTLEHYKELYAAAPDEVQKELCDGTLEISDFDEDSFYHGCTQECVTAYENPTLEADGVTSGRAFRVYNNIAQSGPIEDENGRKTYPFYAASMEYMDYAHYDQSWDDYWNSERRTVKSAGDMKAEELASIGISPEEALTLGEALFIETQTPFSVRDIVFVASDEPFYELSCSRQVNGANLVVGGEGVGGDGLSPYWAYERVRMFVNGDGIFYFYWYSPYETGKTEVENATLLSFEEIESIAYVMIATVYAPRANQENHTTVNVTKVSLELARIEHSEDNSLALLVPVWCFYGARQVDEAIKNEGMASDWELGYSPMIVINAIDGSIIDVEQGY